MSIHVIYRTESYDREELYGIVKKHFEAHGIKNELSETTRVLIKPNLVTNKDAAFAVTTNPELVFAVVRYLKSIGIKNITLADCPGGSLLLFSQMQEIYSDTGYSFLGEHVHMNTDFESRDVESPTGSVNKKFNIINAVADADYVINLPKLKTHNMTCITAGVKNLFGCIPGLQKPAFHAKYPSAKDFSNMLVELAQTVKPSFTLVDAVDIMEGNGPTNGKRRHLGLTFSSKDVFGLDAFITETLGIPQESVATVQASKVKNLISNDFAAQGDTNFVLSNPILLPESYRAKSGTDKLAAKINSLFRKIGDAVFESYPQMTEKCVLCRKCILTCPKNALKIENGKIVVDKKRCIGCLCCDEVCPNAAVKIRKKIKKH